MKNLSLILNVILIIAVAWLYYHVFTEHHKPAELPAISGKGMPANAIVFINSDSLLEDYNFFNTLKGQLEKRQDSIDVALRGQAAKLEKEVTAYQERGASMSAEDRAREEERLMMKQQRLMEIKQSLVESLQDQESAMNDSIHFHLHNYLKEFNRDKNYLFILGYQRGSGILYANDSLDITREVVNGLNSLK